MDRYPLTWPTGWKRTPSTSRSRAKFGRATKYGSSGSDYVAGRPLTMVEATARVLYELERLGVSENDRIISTNVVLRLDGLPRSDQRAPSDPGAAVYWVDHKANDARRCMAVDHYDRVEDNLAAIAATLEAMRAIERHGGAAILDRAFTGFTALPPPMAAGRPWRDVLGVAADERDPGRIRECYRIKRGETHPDRRGGDSIPFLAVQSAFDQAARELGFTP